MAGIREVVYRRALLPGDGELRIVRASSTTAPA